MSLKATIETIIEVLGFRQLDNFINGQYKLQFRISHKPPESPDTLYAKPYLLPPDSNALISDRTFETPEFVPGSAHRLSLNEICGFRLEAECLPAFPGEALIEVYLLLFGLQGEWGRKYPADKRGFSTIGKTLLRLSSLHSPLAEYAEVIFDDLVCCSAALVVHSFLTGYKFEAVARPLGLSPKPQKFENAKNLEELLRVFVDNSQEALSACQENLGQRLRLSLFALEAILQKYLEAIFGGADFRKVPRAKKLREELGQVGPSIEAIRKTASEFQGSKAFCPKDPSKKDPVSEKSLKTPNLKFGEFSETAFLTETKNAEKKMQALKRVFAPSLNFKGPKLEARGNFDSAEPRSEGPFEFLQRGVNKFPEVQQKRLSSAGIDAAIRQLVAHLHDCHACVYLLVTLLVEILQEEAEKIISGLREKYHQNFRERLLVHFFSRQIKVKSLADTIRETPYSNSEIAEIARAKARVLDLELMRLEDITFFDPEKLVPIFFEENFEVLENPNKPETPPKQRKTALEFTHPNPIQNSRDPAKPQKLPWPLQPKPGKGKSHLLVLVHGYKGCDFDMRVYKNHLTNFFPNSLCLISSVNSSAEEKISLFQLGENLAREIKEFLASNSNTREIDKISFIGHSLGGLVIRAALPGLAPLKNRLYTYMSLGSPHLGFIHQSSFLVSAGLKILKAWTSSAILGELDFTDEKRPEARALCRLAAAEGLGWFRQLLLVASPQDGYCPRDSALMQVSPEKAASREIGPVLVEMAGRLLGSLAGVRLVRVDVDVRSNEKSIDWVTGRAPHIMFIDNQMVVLTLFFRYFEFFC